MIFAEIYDTITHIIKANKLWDFSKFSKIYKGNLPKVFKIWYFLLLTSLLFRRFEGEFLFLRHPLGDFERPLQYHILKTRY